MPDNSPKQTVSIVIPCYNKGDLIAQTLKSIDRQTLQPHQVIIVNDGSTDPLTLETLKKIEHEQSSIQIVHQKNGGLSRAREAGFQYVTGAYVLFLDHDDMISQNYLEAAVHHLEKNSEVGFVYGGMVMFGEETALKRAAPFNYGVLTVNNYIHCSSVYRREILEKWMYDATLKVMEDWDFLLQIAAGGVRGEPLPEAYLYYRVAKSGMNRAHSLVWRDAQIRKIRQNRGLHLYPAQWLRYYAGLLLQPLLGPQRRKLERHDLYKELKKNTLLREDINALNLPL